MSETKSPAEYQAAAVQSMRAPAKPSSPVVANAPNPTAPFVTETAEAPLDEAKLIVESEEKKAAPPTPEVKSDSIRKSFEQMAREKAALRAEKEALKPLKTLESRLGPQGLHQLAQAVESGDVAGLLRSLGVKPGDVQFEAAKKKIEDFDQKPDPRYDALQKELAELKKERQSEKYTVGRAKTLDIVKEMAQSAEYSFIADEPKAHDEALKMIEDYIRAHNELPAESRDDSIKMALSAVNERYQEEAKVWEKRLTKVKKPDSITPAESPAQQTSAVSEVGKQASSKPNASRPDSTPKSAEDYQAAAIALLRQTPRT